MKSAACVASLVVALSAAGQTIPPGFKVVQITDDSNAERFMHINDVSQIVYQRVDDDQFVQIYFYDQGDTQQLTHDVLYNLLPSINNQAVITWIRGADYEDRTIVRYESPNLEEITPGTDGEINDRDHIVADRFTDVDCTSSIHFHDGETTQQITDGFPFSDQGPEINNHDMMIWTEYDFGGTCAGGGDWDSVIRMHWDGVTTMITPHQANPQVVHLNNADQIALRYDITPEIPGTQSAVDVWDDGVTTLLTEWGLNPKINDHGDVYFIRWHDDISVWQPWYYTDGRIFRLADDLVWHTDGDINNAGEVVWEHGVLPAQVNQDLSLMQTAQSRHAQGAHHETPSVRTDRVPTFARIGGTSPGPVLAPQGIPAPADLLVEPAP